MKHTLLAAAMVFGMSGTAWAHCGHDHSSGDPSHQHTEKCEKCGKEGKACECTNKAVKKDCGCDKNKKKDAKVKS